MSDSIRMASGTGKSAEQRPAVDRQTEGKKPSDVIRGKSQLHKRNVEGVFREDSDMISKPAIKRRIFFNNCRLLLLQPKMCFLKLRMGFVKLRMRFLELRIRLLKSEMLFKVILFLIPVSLAAFFLCVELRLQEFNVRILAHELRLRGGGKPSDPSCRDYAEGSHDQSSDFKGSHTTILADQKEGAQLQTPSKKGATE